MAAEYDRVSPPRRLRVPHEVAALIRGLHPVLKRKVRAALQAILRDPCSGKTLQEELRGLRSYRVGRFRIIYRLERDLELVAFGPRDSIYLETYRQLHEPRARYQRRGGDWPGIPGGDASEAAPQTDENGRDHRPGPRERGCAPQSAASSYASGGGHAQARWRSP